MPVKNLSTQVIEKLRTKLGHDPKPDEIAHELSGVGLMNLAENIVKSKQSEPKPIAKIVEEKKKVVSYWDLVTARELKSTLGQCYCKEQQDLETYNVETSVSSHITPENKADYLLLAKNAKCVFCWSKDSAYDPDDANDRRREDEAYDKCPSTADGERK